jgi:hypothetical protein
LNNPGYWGKNKEREREREREKKNKFRIWLDPYPAII